MGFGLFHDITIASFYLKRSYFQIKRDKLFKCCSRKFHVYFMDMV